MTIKEQDPPKVRFVSDGTIIPWPFQWRLFSPTYADLIIEYDGAAQVVDASNFTIDYDEEQEAGSVTAKVAPPNGVIIVMRRKTAVERTADFNNINDFKGKPVNLEFDRFLAIAQEHAEDISRSVRRSAKSGSSANLDLPEPVAGRSIVWKPDLSGFKNSDRDLDALGDQSAAALAASEAARDRSEGAASASEASAAQSSTYANNAATARNEAEALVNSVARYEVIRVTSDYVVPPDQNGFMYAVDCSAGPVQIVLPSIAVAGEPWQNRAKKVDNTVNAMTVVCSGSDKMDNGAASAVFTVEGAGALFSSDADPEPDQWAIANFGSSTKVSKRDYFFTLSADTDTVMGTDDAGQVFGYTVGAVVVGVDGRLMTPGIDYDALNGLSIVFKKVLPANSEIYVQASSGFDVADTHTRSEALTTFLQLSGGQTMTGLFELAGDATDDLHPVAKRQLDAVKNYAYVENSDFDSTSSGWPYTAAAATIGNGKECLSLSFTPSRVGAILEVSAVVNIGTNPANWLIAALFVDAGPDAVFASSGYQDVAGGALPLSIQYRYVATSTDEVTFSVRFGICTNASTTAYLNGDNTERKFGMKSSMSVREVA